MGTLDMLKIMLADFKKMNGTLRAMEASGASHERLQVVCLRRIAATFNKLADKVKEGNREV